MSKKKSADIQKFKYFTFFMAGVVVALIFAALVAGLMRVTIQEKSEENSKLRERIELLKEIEN